MVAITAELYGSSTPQLVQIVVTGLVGVSRLNVRAETTGSDRPVRGGVDVVPTSDALVLLDPIPELGRPIIYAVEYVDAANPAGVIVSAPALTVPDPGRHVLSDVYSGRSVLVDVLLDADERTNVARGDVFVPRSSSTAVARWDVRTPDSGVLRVYTADVDELVDVLRSGAPFGSRHPNDGCDQAAVEVLWSPDVSRRRVNRAGNRIFELPYSVVAMPDPQLALTVTTLGDIADYYPTGTLADLAADHATLLDIARADWSL